MSPRKHHDDTAVQKALRLYRKLTLEGRRHFQADLANELECSPQTIIRLMKAIETVAGISFESGLENRRRWYQIRSIPGMGRAPELQGIRGSISCFCCTGKLVSTPSLAERLRQYFSRTKDVFEGNT